MSSRKEPTVLLGKYRLERVLGRGGQGVVWRAHHLHLNAPVAVKMMVAQFAADPDARARFEREARAVSRLRSTHVVQVFDHGVADQTPFIVMELLEGEDLARRLEREGRLSLLAAAEIVSQAARGLHRAHELGLVHRDLKPGNLFLTRTDDGEVVKILDFGVAKATRPSMVGDADPTTEGILLGSPRYMSPEQARGSTHVDHRTDLWALSVIAFRAVTGARPFDGATMVDIIMAICRGERRKATEIVPTLPSEVDAFFDRALALKAQDRFQTAEELAAAFAALALRTKDDVTLGGVGPAPSLTAPSHPEIEAPETLDGSSVSRDSEVPGFRRRTRVLAACAAALVVAAAAFVGLRTRTDPSPAPVAAAPDLPAQTEPAPTTPDDAAAVAPATSGAPAEPQQAPPEPPAAASARTGSPKLPYKPHPMPAPSASSRRKKVSWGF